MSSNTNPSMIVEQNVMVAMRDGVRLATDIYRPHQEGQYPVLLTRVPYDKDLRLPHAPDRRAFLELSLDVPRTVAAGYVVVAQDTRGRYASEGEFNPVADDSADGADTIAWATSQPWSTGQVGMFGESFQGLTQWLAAQAQPEALRTIVPMHAPSVNTSFYTYQGGAFQPATFLWWALTQGAMGEMQRRVAQGRASEADLAVLIQAEQNVMAVFERLPLADQPLLEGVAPYYFDWLADPAGQAARQHAADRGTHSSVTVPALIIGGWYDYFLPSTLAHYAGMKQYAGSALARRPHLIVGPWAHVDAPGIFVERDYGPQASTQAIDLKGTHLRWFDHWLKGIDNGIDREKPVRIFVMGADQWHEETDWPLPDTRYRRYYLHSGGHANSGTGDGLLSTDAPGDEPADAYCYDPHNPVPTVGGAIMLMVPPNQINSGPLDQRQVERREDVLCYTTAPLERHVEIIGPLQLVLYASSSAPDTDFTAKLVDVYPGGRAEILTDGILRARYRQGLATPQLMEPDHIYELRINVGATANVFRAGHRIRLEVSSSNFPRFDRNTNTGGEIAAESEPELCQAVNRVHHSLAYPSHLILPILERY
jgi:uncharacterized protein